MPCRQVGLSLPPPSRRLWSILTGILVFGWAGLGLAGCQKSDEIVSYTIAKPPTRVGTSRSGASRPGPAEGPGDQGVPVQLLGAIIPRGEMTWFFKLTGPIPAVKSQVMPVVDFLRSIRFSEKGPEWDLPEGWVAQPGSGMRYATLRVVTESGALEMSVIPLPTGEGSFDEYLLKNINRWREQLGLAALGNEELASNALKFPLAGAEGWLVNFSGNQSGPPMRGAPLAGSLPRERETPQPAPDQPSPEFTATIPDGWMTVKAGQMQKARYEVREGSWQAAVSVAVAGGDVAANVNRWRGQVQLEVLAQADLEKQMRQIKVDGHDATYAELVGPETAEPRQTILGVIVGVEGRQWFIKLQGDAALAAHEKGRFEEFVQSIRFR